VSDQADGPGGTRPEPRAAHGAPRLREVAWLFLKLGTIGFGGPAAHIAMMHDEVVRRRRWPDEQRFVDLIGATNLIPGPNSTELAIHLGYARARWKGLVTAGVCFILPAFVIVLALAWGYVRYGRTPAVDGLLYGIKPMVIAIIVWALVGLVRTAARGVLAGLLAAAALAGYLLGVNELLILAAGGAVILLVRARPAWLGRAPLSLLLPLLAAGQSGLSGAATGQLGRLPFAGAVVALWRRRLKLRLAHWGGRRDGSCSDPAGVRSRPPRKRREPDGRRVHVNGRPPGSLEVSGQALGLRRRCGRRRRVPVPAPRTSERSARGSPGRSRPRAA
jgi:chromate transport protein ChrA